MRRILHRVPLLAVALSATLLASCASAPDTGENASVGLPAGVTVDVYQTRTDLPARKLEIAITNASDEDLTVTGAEFASPQFVAPAVWTPRPGGTVIRAGAGVDLPVQLAEPACDEPAPAGLVRIRFTTADGRTGSAELPAVDRYDRLPGMRTEECFAIAVGDVASLTIDEPVRVESAGGALVGLVPVTVSPTGAKATFTIDAIEDTVLLGLSDGRGGALESLPLALEISGSAPPSSFEIPIVPGRCDPHAIAEDKQGTIFILQVTAPDGTTGRMRIAAAPSARASIYEFFAAACGLP
ncbi:MAG TPA: hypothetical protein VNQ52_05500 [Microbacteriaceae bacterium]|nr:hypothetical protein [Microbacteriaceae bacterium]